MTRARSWHMRESHFDACRTRLERSLERTIEAAAARLGAWMHGCIRFRRWLCSIADMRWCSMRDGCADSFDRARSRPAINVRTRLERRRRSPAVSKSDNQTRHKK